MGFVRIWSAVQRESNPKCPCMGRSPSWAQSLLGIFQEHTDPVCREMHNFKPAEYGDHLVPLLLLKGGSAAHLSSGLCEQGMGGQPVAGCPDSLMGVSALLEPGAEVRSGHPWSSHERRCLYVLTASWETDGHKEQVPALVPSLVLPSILYFRAKREDAAPALLCSSQVGVQRAPRVRGSTSAKCPHSTTAPCLTGRMKPFMHDFICATAIYLQFLARFLFPFFLF